MEEVCIAPKSQWIDTGTHEMGIICLYPASKAGKYRAPFRGKESIMARICPISGKRPVKGSHIWRSGKAKKKGGIGTHVTAITKRRFFPNLQSVRVILPSGQVKRMRVATSAIKKGLITKAPKRTWKKKAA
ncbi:MAG: hypothetical protein RIS76_1203 [Verrucomicrobiota bacterium]|jgi:large subunit ribosomal protein L28